MLKISIIIPLYNKSPYILRAINSVLGQTEKSFEILVIDDGSTDGGPEVIKNIKDSRIKLIQQANQGVSVARNVGISESSADLVAFLDADDAWKNNFLETVLRLKNRHPEARAYSTAYEIIETDGTHSVFKYRGIPASPWEGVIPNYFKSASSYYSPVWTSATAISKEVFNIIGNFPAGERIGEDLDMWLRVALRYPVAFSNHVCASYFLRNKEEQLKGDKFYLCEYQMIRTAREALKSRRMLFRDKFYLNEYKNFYQLILALYCILTDEKQSAQSHLKDCRTFLYLWKKIVYLVLLNFPGVLTKRIIKLKQKIIRYLSAR
ncbi:MAG: glycosyltransferase family 2 protein [Candidatus Omnitrophota bacterium]|jgi:glycosyltransferase involved in cell wall biosynthesis